MKVKDEGKDLYERSGKLFKSVILTIISFLQCIVQIGILFFTIWITVFTKGKELFFEWTNKVTTEDIISLPSLLRKGE